MKLSVGEIIFSYKKLKMFYLLIIPNLQFDIIKYLVIKDKPGIL